MVRVRAGSWGLVTQDDGNVGGYLHFVITWQPSMPVQPLAQGRCVSRYWLTEYRHGILTVTVVKGNNLLAMDPNGKSDPYVVVAMANDDTGDEENERRTSVCQNTLNPVWGDQFRFVVSLLLVIERCLYSCSCTVHDALGCTLCAGMRTWWGEISWGRV